MALHFTIIVDTVFFPASFDAAFWNFRKSDQNAVEKNEI